MKKVITCSLVLASLASSSYAAISFSVSFTAQALASYSVAEQQMFTDGMAYWDSVIDGHQDNGNRNFNLQVDTISQAASQGSLVLGSAEPSGRVVSAVVAGSGLGGNWPGRFILSSGGSASFNTHENAGDLRADVILHEIGHALGIGTLWEDNELYNDGNPQTGNRTLVGGIAGQYTGANALAAYQAEFSSALAYIPVEQGGGAGTANGHWNESDGGMLQTGITDAGGQDFMNELMTGWASPNEANTFISNTTKASLVDLGYTLEPVPEPSSTALLGLGGLALIMRRRK